MPRFTETHGRTSRLSPSNPDHQPLSELQWATADMLLAHVGGIVEELLYQRLGAESYHAIADDVPLYTEAFQSRFERIIHPDEPEQLPKNVSELRRLLSASFAPAIEDIKDKLGVDALPAEQEAALRNVHLDLCRTFIEAVGSKRDVAPATESRGRQ